MKLSKKKLRSLILKEVREQTLTDYQRDPYIFGKVNNPYDEIELYTKQQMREADPAKGTGKKPKGSGRRLYTDENPKDTVKIKFATPADARATVAKVKKVKKPFARKIQILTVGEQRAKVMGKTQVVSIFKKGKEALRRAKKRG